MSPSTTQPEPTAEADALMALLGRHRSIRRFDAARTLDPAWVDNVLHAALHGSSSSGNLNLVSVVKTADKARKSHLRELHFGQPMVDEAPLVLTFCADSFRTRQWLQQRDARLGFADFISWHIAGYDAIILAQTAALAFEAHGLGICYMGTTLHAMGAIAEVLGLPENCLPVTSMVVGWPAEAPAQRDRLPARAWIHDERYQRPTPADIDERFGQRDVRGWQRYRAARPEMVEEMAQHGIHSLAQFYTSKIKYDPDRFALDSAALAALLRERGFLHEP